MVGERQGCSTQISQRGDGQRGDVASHFMFSEDGRIARRASVNDKTVVVLQA